MQKCSIKVSYFTSNFDHGRPDGNCTQWTTMPFSIKMHPLLVFRNFSILPRKGFLSWRTRQCQPAPPSRQIATMKPTARDIFGKSTVDNCRSSVSFSAIGGILALAVVCVSAVLLDSIVHHLPSFVWNTIQALTPRFCPQAPRSDGRACRFVQVRTDNWLLNGNGKSTTVPNCKALALRK